MTNQCWGLTVGGGLVSLLASVTSAFAQASPPTSPVRPATTMTRAPGQADPPRPLVYGGSDHFGPWESLDDRGGPDGFNVALVRALGRHTGRPVVVTLTPWARVVHGLETGTVDLSAMGVSTARRTRFDFLPIIWTLHQTLTAPAERTWPLPDRLTSLSGEIVAVERGSLMHEVLLDLPPPVRPAMVLARSSSEALRAVLEGQGTLALGNAQAMRHAAGALDARRTASREVMVTGYHFVTGPGRAREFAWLEPALAELKANGTFATLIEQYLTPRSAAPTWSVWAFVLTGGVLLTAVVVALTWYRRVRRVVAAKVQAEALSVRRRQEAEQALHATERQMQQLVHSVKAIVWRHDLAAGQYTFVSQEAEQLLGYPAAHWLADAGFVDGIIHADDRAWVRSYSARATAEQRDHTMEYRVVTQDGRLVWLRDIVSVMVAEGAARELIGVMVDISEYKAAEEALEAAHARALAATRAKSEFLASMSHEIRTPMNAVIGITDLLLDTPLTTEQRQFVETVRSSGDVLLNVINDILDFSKVESGKLEFERIGLDPERLADEVARLMGERATARGLDLTCRIVGDIPGNLIGDPGRLRQVLLNLVGNAIKFTERGDVAIRVSASDIASDHATVRFEVSDTGIGISPDAQARLFEAFTQADASTTRRFGGTGLGLAISRRIIELLGGRIGVESVPGEGTTFWFTVPCPRVGGVAAPLRPGTLGGMRVLVVDDSRASRMMLEQTLLDAGMIVQTARDADDAMAVLRPDAWPHVALIDEGLADGGATRQAEQLRARAPHPVAVLLLSARLSGTPVTMERAARVMKPVRRSELLAAIDAIGRPVVAEVGPTPQAPVTPAGAPAAARVLVAEDNPVNQKVARLMLEKSGCRVDVVEHGALAVEAVRTGAYDLVLMDCQMPVCDGFEATRRIRALASPHGHIVIVALTANALAGDRERCLASGMNDYLAKPVRRDALAGILERYLPGVASAHTAA
ncbi:response regulator [Luteitalea sp.]|uniref:response regulator n=1 Tax=Luteitalea sp. TaxID=2004800 RepID=UPI0025C40569|nr:response regulator [Luteitalea sp.]